MPDLIRHPVYSWIRACAGNDNPCRKGIDQRGKKLSPNSRSILKQAEKYIQTIDVVMSFLQYRDNTLAQLFCNDNFLPRASRFDSMPDLEWSFGNIGINDQARFWQLFILRISAISSRMR
jgi:hypothetical protein